MHAARARRADAHRARAAARRARAARPASSRGASPRAADDGYRNPLVPGLRATADAERLAAALAWADARLEPPGPHPAVAEEPDMEEAIWLAFLLALADPGAHRAARGDRRRRTRAGRAASCPRSPASTRARSRPTARGPSAPARRPTPSSASPAGRRSGASGARSSASRCPGLRPRRALRAAGHARRRRARRGGGRRAAPRQGGGRDHDRGQARARVRRPRCCSSAAPPSSRAAAGSASARSTARSRSGARATRPTPRRPPAIRSALGLR